MRYTINTDEALRIVEAIDKALEKRDHVTAIRKIIGNSEIYESLSKEQWNKLALYLTEKNFLKIT